jgi:hypothetical protein
LKRAVLRLSNTHVVSEGRLGASLRHRLNRLLGKVMVIAALKDWLEDSLVSKVGHNAWGNHYLSVVSSVGSKLSELDLVCLKSG